PGQLPGDRLAARLPAVRVPPALAAAAAGGGRVRLARLGIRLRRTDLRPDVRPLVPELPERRGMAVADRPRRPAADKPVRRDEHDPCGTEAACEGNHVNSMKRALLLLSLAGGM